MDNNNKKATKTSDLSNIKSLVKVRKDEKDAVIEEMMVVFLPNRGTRQVKVSAFNANPVYYLKLYPVLQVKTNASDAQMKVIAATPREKLIK